MLNVTATKPATNGYLTVHPCAGGPPEASNLNVVAGSDAANFVLVRPDDTGRVCVTPSTDTHVIVDVLGWTGDAFVGRTPSRLVDSR